MTHEPSIEELLRRAGYGHRRTENSINTGEHEVFSLLTGELVGKMDALEAADFAKRAGDRR